jgi:hypothetical protein
MHERFGWQHLLCARGQPLDGPNDMYSYDGFGRNVPITTTSHGPKSYAEIVEDLESNTSHPHLYEERHSYRREGFDLDMDGTRRLLWWEAMAGGMGGFFGFYRRSSGAFAGYPYPHPEQLRTHHTFWHENKRFLLDMQRANDLSGSGAYVLKNSTSTNYILYQENTNAIEIDLRNMKGPRRAVAVDTERAYAEIDLGVLKPAVHTLEPGSSSDWAVAVGEFGSNR